MDRSTLELLLSQAENRVVRGDALIAEQRSAVLRLQQTGLPHEQSAALLKRFEDTQEMHIADRDRLQKEVDRISSVRDG